LFPAKRDVETDQAAKRRPELSSRCVLLACTAACYDSRRFRPRRWQGMAAEIRIAAAGGGALAAKRGVRIPHLIFREVLGPAGVGALLQYATAREADFRPAIVRDRRSGKQRVDKARRDCLALGDLGAARRP